MAKGRAHNEPCQSAWLGLTAKGGTRRHGPTALRERTTRSTVRRCAGLRNRHATAWYGRTEIDALIVATSIFSGRKLSRSRRRARSAQSASHELSSRQAPFGTSVYRHKILAACVQKRMCVVVPFPQRHESVRVGDPNLTIGAYC